MSVTVLISEASGFIVLHIVSQLLKQNYKVIGTVRSHEKKAKLLRQFQHNPNLFLEIVPDILNQMPSKMSLRDMDRTFATHCIVYLCSYKVSTGSCLSLW